MKEKIKKILKNWRTLLEIGVVIWAINGMLGTTSLTSEQLQSGVDKGNLLWYWVSQTGLNLPLAIALSYFLSAVLILYLLRKYERKN